MDKGVKIACFLLGMVFLFPIVFPPGVSSQEADSAGEGQRTEAPFEARTIPEALRRPERGEAPRYPQDLVIGELGQGDAPEGAYLFALGLLKALMTGSKDDQILAKSPSILTESLLEEINSLEPRSYRLGGGRIEADGNVSFLVRFLGSGESISGELFLREAEKTDGESETPQWLLDDLILEEKRALVDIKDGYRYDFTPYERFY